jgi:hypothetical protein
MFPSFSFTPTFYFVEASLAVKLFSHRLEYAGNRQDACSTFFVGGSLSPDPLEGCRTIAGSVFAQELRRDT